MKIGRRSFLKSAGAVAAIGAIRPALGELQTNSPITEPRRMPLLMPDDFSDLHLTEWRVEPGTPDVNNPLIEGHMPWDSGGVGIHGTVLIDPLDGKWKAYVVCTPPEETSKDWPHPWVSENAKKRRLCLFESNDGVHWIRPAFSPNGFGNHTTTNILFDLAHGTSAYGSVLIDPSNHKWPYEMFVLRERSTEGTPPLNYPGKLAFYRYRSRDGKAWQLFYGPITKPMSDDIAFFYREPDGGYVSYYRVPGTRQPNEQMPSYETGANRSIYRATSPDGNVWTRDESALVTADDLDHRDTQYNELIPHKVEGGYLGLVSIYHPLSQTQDLRIGASRDGRHWWFPDRRPIVGNAPLGDYGGGTLWQSHNMIVENDTLYVYYGAAEGTHRQLSETQAPSKVIGYEQTVISKAGGLLPFNTALCRSHWQVDRLYALASSAGGPTVGIATTKSQDLAGKELWVDIVTRPAKKNAPPAFGEGHIEVELLDSGDQPIPGFEREDCQLLRGDHHSLLVNWRGNVKAPVGAKKARFYLKRAFLYGFDFRA